MRDKYNLNTLPPGVEEDYGNIGDSVTDTKNNDSSSREVSIPGMAPEDRVESTTVIPGLDFSHSPADTQVICASDWLTYIILVSDWLIQIIFLSLIG